MAERFDVALPRQHRLAGSGPLALADLADEQWIFANTDACRDIAFNACVAAGFTPTTAHTIGDWDATLTAVGMGLGVALVPRLIDSRPNHRVSIRELHDHRPQRHVIAVVRQGAQHAGHIAAVLHALAEAAERRATRGEPGPRIVQPA
jgi:DNA-binding transcriptional LysR family regulator